MIQERFHRAKSVFLLVSEASPGEWEWLLAQACGEDGELQAEVRELLAHQSVGGEGGGPDARRLEGRRIGAYEIRRLIAEGGMGCVYEAVQERPRRLVALKLVREGLTSARAARRFEYEAEILGRLRHPGVAAIFDAGMYEDESGRHPYFAMEHIPDARSLTAFARERGLSTRERLALFAQVCDGVAHGHQHGIIHRDLKPSNILVDESGRAKVIDFGVARFTDCDVAATIQADAARLVGTIQYMSPEQCEAGPEGVDIRCDVYSLGVVLHELVTERLPYDVAGVSLIEACRMIREARPAPLPAWVDRDVATIINKALEKDREARYRSADALGDDIRRQLAHEPIEARRPTFMYQARMFSRRHRAAVILASIAATVFVLGSAGTTGALIWAGHEARRAAGREKDLLTELRARNLSSAVFRELRAQLRMSRGGERTRGEIFDEAASHARERMANDPESRLVTFLGLGQMAQEARLREHARAYVVEAADAFDEVFVDPFTSSRLVIHATTISDRMIEAGEPAKAEAILLRVTPPEPRAYGMSIMQYTLLAQASLDQGKVESARAHSDLAYGLSLRDRAPGPLHLEALRSRSALLRRLGDPSWIKPLEDQVAIARRIDGAPKSMVVEALRALAEALEAEGREADAAALREEMRRLTASAGAGGA